MKYSTAFRANILKKVLPPENRSVLEVSKENGISCPDNLHMAETGKRWYF